MPAVQRIAPKTIFSDDEWAPLAKRSTLRALGCVAHAYALIIAAGALVIVWPNPLTYILAVTIIGARQLGLAILMHDAAHGALSPHQKVNDWIGQWLCAGPIGTDVLRYRPYHLQHHRFTEQPEDPDLGLSRPFPITKGSFWRKVVRDLTGQTFYKQRIAPSIQAFLSGKQPTKEMDETALRFWVTNGIIIGVTTVLGYWWAWFALWLVPFATWQQLITRLRNIAEHACVGKHDDPFRHARTTLANPLERLLIAPYWVHYHSEHHVFMHVPCYRLEQLHGLLMEKGFAPRMAIAESYPAMLRVATSKAA
ncbi:MAG: fatty acid desaturase [Alphaproteobacteria bacterium]|nr:fatty acid desaturase [Alphaproteobacteria bacterium]